MADHRVGKIYVELDLDKTRYMRGQQTLLKEAQKGAKVLEKNFHNLGMKSAATFDLMRAQAQQSFKKIAESGKSSSLEIVKAHMAMSAKMRKISAEQYNNTLNMNRLIRENWVKMTVGMYAAWRGLMASLSASSKIFTAGMQSEQMKRAFTEIAGGSREAAKELNFLRDVSDRLGQNFWDLQGSYKSLLAASKSTALAGAQTRDIFESITRASATLGLSTDKTKLILYATEQMMSKGKITAEELRRQMGDNLPGAFSTAAVAMGVSMRQLDAMMKKGELMADEFLPKFADALKRKYTGEVVESVRALNKWNEALVDLRVEIAESGFLDRATEIMKELTGYIKDPSFQQGMKDFANGMLEVLGVLAKIGKYAGLRPISETIVEATHLAEQGKFTMKEFWAAGFYERQLMVDSAKREGKIVRMEIKDTRKEMEKNTVVIKEVIEWTDKEMKHLEKAFDKLRKNQAAREAAAAMKILRDGVMASKDAVKQMTAEFETNMTEVKQYVSLMDEIQSKRDELSDGSLFEGSIFGDDASESVNNLMKSLNDLYDMYGKLADREKDIIELRKKADEINDPADRAKAIKEIAELEKQYTMDSIQTQMEGFTQLFGAIKNMYEENTEEHKRWAMVEKATAIASILLKAAMAIINAGASGDGYTAIARMAAMAAAVGAVLSQVGLSMSGPSGSGGGGQATPTPVTTVLGGDPGQISESLQNSLEMLEDNHAEQYGALIDIYKEIRQLNHNITGLVTHLIKSGTDFGFEGGEVPSSVGMFQEVFTQWFADTFTKSTLFVSGDPIVALITKFVGDFLGDIVGYIFGGGERTDLIASGIRFVDIDFNTLLEGGLVDVKGFGLFDKVTEGGLFGDDDHEQFFKYIDLSKQTVNLFTKVLVNMGQSMLALSEGLGYGADKVDEIRSYVIDIKRMDLKGLNAKQIAERINNMFSSLADTMAGEFFGDLIMQYQKVDEGLYETAVRLVMEKAMVLEALEMTGQAFRGTAAEAVHFSQALLAVAGDLDTLMDAAESYFEQYYTDAEKHAWLVGNLAESYKRIGVEMPATRQGFKDLISGLDLTTKEGMELYAALLRIAGATDAYYDTLEKGTQKIIALQRELAGTTDEGTVADISKRYGWTLDKDAAFSIIQQFLAATPEEVQAFADAMGVSVDQLVADIKSLATIFDYLGEAADDATGALSTTMSAIKTWAASIRSSLDSIRSQIAGGGAGSSAGGLLKVVKAQRAKITEKFGDVDLSVTMEDLTAMTANLVSWYNAAVAEAQEAARLEAEQKRETLQAEQSALQEQLSVAQAFKSLVAQINSTIRSIRYSDLNIDLPTLKATKAQSDYSTLLTAARSGGVDEIQEFQSFVSTYLQQRGDRYKSSEQYQQDYAQAMRDLESLRNSAEAMSYDEAIVNRLSEIKAELAAIKDEADLSGINSTFTEMANYIEGMIAAVEQTQMILEIDWSTWSGDQADALEILQFLVTTYGWTNTYTLDFLNKVPMTIFKDIDDAAHAAKWIANESGGWDSKATLSFLMNFADNWKFQNLNEILQTIGWVKEQSGSWTSKATITYIAQLMDRYNVPIADMPAWLAKLGVTGTKIPDVIAKLIMQAEDWKGVGLDSIDAYLTSLGFTDTALTRKLKVTLIYEMVAQGDIDLKQVAQYAYNMGMSASIMQPEVQEAKNILLELQSLGSMWGINTATLLGQAVRDQGINTNPANWPGLWGRHNMLPYWAEGTVVNRPTIGVVGEAGYPEAVVPMKDGHNIPVKITGMGGSQVINLTVQIAGDEFEGEVKSWADEAVVLRNKAGQAGGTERLFR